MFVAAHQHLQSCSSQPICISIRVLEGRWHASSSHTKPYPHQTTRNRITTPNQTFVVACRLNSSHHHCSPPLLATSARHHSSPHIQIVTQYPSIFMELVDSHFSATNQVQGPSI